MGITPTTPLPAFLGAHSGRCPVDFQRRTPSRGEGCPTITPSPRTRSADQRAGELIETSIGRNRSDDAAEGASAVAVFAEGSARRSTGTGLNAGALTEANIGRNSTFADSRWTGAVPTTSEAARASATTGSDAATGLAALRTGDMTAASGVTAPGPAARACGADWQPVSSDAAMASIATVLCPSC